ncbi:MAG: hypothetical protein ACREI9_05610 [Nitrospiraceae bacterium]
MRLPGTRDDERFFFSRFTPRPFVCWNLAIAKVTVWGPWPFVSVAIGWFLGAGPSVRALQMYIGVKADAAQSYKYNRVVMVLTPKELAAIRIHGVSVDAAWTDQGGS